MRVVVAGLKGGVGKTTSSVHLAVSIARANPKRRVLLLDHDRQRQSVHWAYRADAAGTPLPVTAAPWGEIAETGYDDVVIDTPPYDEMALRLTAPGGGIALLPCAPTYLDADRVAETVGKLAEWGGANMVARVVLTSVRKGTKTASAVRAFLTEAGLTVCATEIPRREVFATAYGALPRPSVYDDLAKELTRAR